MNNNNFIIPNLSQRKIALIAGIGLLIMVFCAPISEFSIFPKLIEFKDPEATFNNILSNRMLFVVGILCYVLTFISDFVVAWALYVFFIPTNRNISLLTGWFRLVYGVLSFVALSNLIRIVKYISNDYFLELLGKTNIESHIFLLYNNYRIDWSFALLIFGLHLILLGYLAYKSGYVPKIFGILLAVAGLGYAIDTLQPYLYPNFSTGFLFITFLGEIAFMFWLLIRGGKTKLKENE